MAEFYASDAARIGDHNVICDRCGSKVPASWTVKEWTGLRVCRVHKDVDARHPQEFVRGRRDVQKVPFARPPSTPTFVNDHEPIGLLLALTKA